jgi:hypothetical protein
VVLSSSSLYITKNCQKIKIKNNQFTLDKHKFPEIPHFFLGLKKTTKLVWKKFRGPIIFSYVHNVRMPLSFPWKLEHIWQCLSQNFVLYLTPSHNKQTCRAFLLGSGTPSGSLPLGTPSLRRTHSHNGTSPLQQKYLGSWNKHYSSGSPTIGATHSWVWVTLLS